MKYNEFINLCNGLLIGDNMIPSDANVQLALFSYACDKISNEADALKLFVDNTNQDILRDGPGYTYVRKIVLPTIISGSIDSDYEIDIDQELCYPLARYFCSFITKDKMQYHVSEAEALIRIFNSKVEAHIARYKQKQGYK